METIIGNSREYLYENILPKNCICAEIGVQDGINSDRIIKFSNPKKLYLVDSWGGFGFGLYKKRIDEKGINDYKNAYQEVKNKFKNNDNVEIIRDLSVNASKQFEDNYFDWAYIDADHEYESVKEDIESWWPKIKNNGFLCGHDYFNASLGAIIVGVKRAVDEFIKNNNLELYYRGNNCTFEISEWCILKK